MPIPTDLAARATPEDAPGRLARAGVGGVPCEVVGRARLVGATLGLLIAFPAVVIWPPALVASVPAVALGYATPDAILRRAERARVRAVRRALPAALDLLAICVNGGMALDPALAALERHTEGPLSDELGALTRAIELGQQRGTAFQALVDRCPCEEVASFVAAVRQSEDLGAPLAPILGAQARSVRDGARRAALEHAATAAPKIQLVTAIVLVPAAMIVIVATLLLHLASQIGVAVGGP